MLEAGTLVIHKDFPTIGEVVNEHSFGVAVRWADEDDDFVSIVPLNDIIAFMDRPHCQACEEGFIFDNYTKLCWSCQKELSEYFASLSTDLDREDARLQSEASVSHPASTDGGGKLSSPTGQF